MSGRVPILSLAGTAGFEPAHAGVKVPSVEPASPRANVKCCHPQYSCWLSLLSTLYLPAILLWTCCCRFRRLHLLFRLLSLSSRSHLQPSCTALLSPAVILSVVRKFISDETSEIFIKLACPDIRMRISPSRIFSRSFVHFF